MKAGFIGRWVAIAFVALLAAAPAPLRAAEIIENYDVILEPRANGDIRVTERITVHAEGKNIRRGIYRDFPLENRQSYQPRVPYVDIDATRDGLPETIARTETTDIYHRIYLGKAGRFLTVPRTYTFEIRYTYRAGILQFADRDEIYFNAIPTQWDFVIKRAAVTVLLPDGMKAERVAVFSGPHGAQGNARNAAGDILDNGTRVRVESTAPLPPRNGITVAVQLPPEAVAEGYVDPGLKASVIKVLVVLGYVLIGVAAWIFVGRDPEPRTVVPQFEAPPGISPAAARYIYNFGNVDGSHLMATGIVSAASKGSIRIEDDGGKIVCTGKNYGPLSRGERTLLCTLFRNHEKSDQWTEGETFEFNDTRVTANRLAKGWEAMHAALEKEFAESHFRKNAALRGLMLVMAGLAAVFTAFYWGPEMVRIPMLSPTDFAPLLFFFFAFGWRFVPALVAKVWPSRFLNWNSLNSGRQRLYSGVLALICAGVLAGVLIYLGAGLYQWIAAGLIFTLALAFLTFDQVLQSRTIGGLDDVAYLQGLRMYIAAAEHNQFKGLEPEPTPEQFTRLYPYAYALRLNNVWTEKFADQLAQWSKTSAAGMGWFYGSGWHHGSARQFDHLGRNVSSSNSGASIGSTSSIGSGQYSSGSFGGGGFGGGGFSGGGGGGGGGGGW